MPETFKKENPTPVFSYDNFEFFKNTYIEEQLQMTASEKYLQNVIY